MCTELTGLTVLSVEGTKIRGTSFLTDLPNLRELHFLDNEQVSQLPPLKSARKLETLYLDSDELLTETSVAALSNMHELKLRITKRLSFLSPMTKLERLTLYSYQSSLDLTPLASLKNLRFLSFTSGNSFYDSYTTSLFNLGSLRGLPLEELVIENKSFYEPIDAVFEISTLRKLNLRGTSSEGTNYAKLKNLQQLQTLLMDGYREMRDVPPGEYERFWSYETVPASAFGSYLGELTGLQVLAASDCGLEAIDFVRQMPKLNYLDIANNAVTDLSPLAELKQLKYVRLTGNPVADYAPVDGRRDMTVIR